MDAESIDASPMLTHEIEEGTGATQKPF